MKSRNLIWVFAFSLLTAITINAIELNTIKHEIPETDRASLNHVNTQALIKVEI